MFNPKYEALGKLKKDVMDGFMKDDLENVDKEDKELEGGEAGEMEYGIECEKKEHPELPDEEIQQLVTDHLKKDPEYYQKEHEMEESNMEESTEHRPGGEEEGVESFPEHEVPKMSMTRVAFGKRPTEVEIDVEKKTHGFQKGHKGYRK
jgi:hypothetical protein